MRAGRPGGSRDAALALFLSLPLPIVVLAVHYGPSPSEPAAPAWLLSRASLWAAAGAALGFAAYRPALAAERREAGGAALLAATAGLILLSAGLGSAVHRDFFTAAFQYLMALPIAVLYRIGARSRPGRRIGSHLAMGRAGVVVAAFYAQWVMLMGYAIATRAEPRPIEALAYNLYDLAQVLALVLASKAIERNARHVLAVGEETLSVDGRDVLPVLGQRKAAILRALASSPDRRLTCLDVQGALGEPGTSGEGGGEGRDACAGCGEKETKAALCPRYRSAYNSVLELKRILEFLEIGAIVAPENKRKVLTEGWRLSLFEGSRIVLRTRKRAPAARTGARPLHF